MKAGQITPFHPVIAKFFTQMGRSEELGTGIRNIFKYIKAYSGNETATLIDDELFTVTIPTEKVTENRKKILASIRKNPRITIPQIVLIIGISERKVKANISTLKSSNLIKRIGPDRGGYWQVL